MIFLKFVYRRIRQITALAVLIMVVSYLIYQLDMSLQRTSFITGWTVLGICGLLTGYNLRKRLTFLPILGSSRAWMQIHIYFGFLAVVVFLFHIGFRIPNGQFEFLLASLFMFVSMSGFYGLYITRVVPRKLTAVREEVVFEKIPSLRVKLCNQARKIVEECASFAPSLSDFYLERLAFFFESPRSVAYFAMPNGRMKRSLILELSNMNRYLPEDGRESSKQLIELVSKKDDLDYHLAMQGRLKLWLFVHIATTYSMLIFAAFHTVLVHAFHGGLR
ncbi:hypothetical protein N9189_03780 [Pirellulaceae bacterium]|nr:hypothetical protein [Pirellulaceae bacterium]